MKHEQHAIGEGKELSSLTPKSPVSHPNPLPLQTFPMPAMQATLKSLTLLDFEQSLFCSKICKQEYLISKVRWVVREELKPGGWIRIHTFTRALTTHVTSLLKYSRLQIFEQKRDFLQPITL